MNSDDPQAPHPKPDLPGQKKVFDVVRPGKATASPNSRNVITHHKPPVKDDMFVPGPGTRLAGNPNEKRPLMDPDSKRAVVPISDSEEATASSAEAKPELPTPVKEQATDENSKLSAPTLPPAPEPETASEPEPTVPEEKPELWEIESTAPTLDDSPPLPQDNTKSELNKPTPEQVAMDQTVESPAPSEPSAEPFPPPAPEPKPEPPAKPMNQDDVLAATEAPLLDQAIVSHHRHRTKWWAWLLIFVLIVTIALVALNFLLDAEVLTVEVSVPHTNVIN